jgi:hypothetical protein
MTVDGVVQDTTTVGAYMNPNGDGSWTRQNVATASEACQSLSGQLSVGTHTLRVVDVSGRVLAEGTYTLTP